MIKKTTRDVATVMAVVLTVCAAPGFFAVAHTMWMRAGFTPSEAGGPAGFVTVVVVILLAVAEMIAIQGSDK